jgi:hypothetical protein
MDQYFIDWFPNKPVELKIDKAYRIGRGGGNEFYLPDYHASREHAEISWNGEAFVLKDLNSSNGTLVNGEKVVEKVLEPGDEVQIGMHVLKLRAEDSATVVEDFERQSKQVQEWKTAVGSAYGEGGFSGSLAEVALPQIIQVLEGGKKTGRLLITCIGATGSIFLKEGRVVAASYESENEGTFDDHEAFYRMITLDDGVFELLSEDIDFDPRMLETTQALLMEAARRVDEKNRDSGGSLPSDTVRFT